MAAGKIDTHQHFFPKAYIDSVGLDVLAAQMPSRRAPDWSPEKAIAMMETNGIAEGILSVSSVSRLPNATTVLRQCNEAAAELRGKYPGRFGSFANLPLPDVDASLREVAYARDELSADGFIVFTSYEGRYLGDADFQPLWEELDRRGAVVLVHPNEPNYAIPNIAPASVLEFPFETTRAATSLILSGVIERFSRIRFILSHAGGTLPYLLPRISLSMRMMPGIIDQVGTAEDAFRAFYYDTALASGRTTFAALAEFVDPTHILFGTDFPMAPDFGLKTFNEELERLDVPGLSRPAIYRGNAAQLLGRDA
jgi:6-methylsalicylate decarboxylase